jgi:phosphinothricin acetyltransferase
MEIQPFTKLHWDEVKEIYRQGLEGRNATFETEVPDFDAWHKKFHPKLLWIVMDNNKVLGWAGLQPTSTRNVYEGVMEVTIYVRNDKAGQGIGTALMRHLIEESEVAGIWSLYASVFPENKASIRLHLSNGFREIGFRERIGQLDGQWRDTILFERRSKRNGI